jgi:hypothetical protein
MDATATEKQAVLVMADLVLQLEQIGKQLIESDPIRVAASWVSECLSEHARALKIDPIEAVNFVFAAALGEKRVRKGANPGGAAALPAGVVEPMTRAPRKDRRKKSEAEPPLGLLPGDVLGPVLGSMLPELPELTLRPESTPKRQKPSARTGTAKTRPKLSRCRKKGSAGSSSK